MPFNVSQSNVDRSKSAQIRSVCWALTAAIGLLILPVRSASAAELHMGGATVNITPKQPVALSGQMHTRIARTVESPVTATALALESRDGVKVFDQVIMVSCDLVAIREGILEMVRDRVKERIADFDVEKLLLNATHTRTPRR